MNLPNGTPKLKKPPAKKHGNQPDYVGPGQGSPAQMCVKCGAMEYIKIMYGTTRYICAYGCKDEADDYPEDDIEIW